MKEMHLGDKGNQHSPILGKNSEKSRQLLERLARYLAESPYLVGDTIVFKGGLFLGEHTGHPRYTQDVDMSIALLSTYEKIKVELSNFGESLIATGDIATYEIQDDVQPKRSGGAKYRDINGMVLLSIDISLGADTLDTVVIDTEVAGRVQLESIEQVMADKLTVLYSRSRFRRSKDLFDVWQILQSCQLNEERLIACLSQRGIYPLPVALAPFREECYVQMEHAYSTLQIRDPLGGDSISKPSFEEVVQVVGKFTRRFMEVEV